MAELSPEELERLRKTFESFDLNHDGFIDLNEFHALLLKLERDVTQGECLLDFEEADSEGDGFVGFKEFVVWWTS